MKHSKPIVLGNEPEVNFPKSSVHQRVIVTYSKQYYAST